MAHRFAVYAVSYAHLIGYEVKELCTFETAEAAIAAAKERDDTMVMDKILDKEIYESKKAKQAWENRMSDFHRYAGGR